MRLSDLIRDPHDGMVSIVKVCALVGSAVLQAAFVIQAKYRDLDWMDYVGYACALTIISGAPIANRIVGFLGPRLAGQGGNGHGNGATTPVKPG